MKNKKSIIMIVAHIIVITAVVLLLVFSLGYMTDRSMLNAITYIDSVTATVNGGPEQNITLPYSFESPEPRTPIELRTVVFPKPGDTIYIKSVYSPAKIYANNTLVYEFGIQEKYPNFMLDPATEVHIIELDGFGSEVNLRMEFLSPVSRNVTTVHPFMIGTTKNVIFNLFHKLGVPLAFSIMQIIVGLSLIFVSVFIIFLDKKGALFLWLGLFSLTTGMWSFGENNFTNIIIKNPTFLYLMAFIGLFTFIIPLLRFVRTIIDFENPKPIWFIELFALLSASIALFLQLSGILSCSKSMYFFHATLPLILLFLTIYTIREYIIYKNTHARRFILPIAVLTLSAFLELFNYRIPITYIFSSLFQMGIIFFIIIMGITAGFTIKDSLDIKNKEKELSFEKNLMDIEAQEQQNRNILLAEHKKILSQQRHDLRHHLTVIQGLAAKENYELQNYLSELINSIPTPPKAFCENSAVNAVVSHYYGLCEQKGIEISICLAVPENNPDILDGSLCSIFGNLLENAIEACDRMTKGKKFINLKSSLQHNTLIITMDNSFNGKFKIENNRFFSAKRNNYGIGLSSISSIAEKSHGNAEFKGCDNVFQSSVYLNL